MCFNNLCLNHGGPNHNHPRKFAPNKMFLLCTAVTCVSEYKAAIYQI